MNKSVILTAAAFGLGLASVAHAQNRVHITGATAFRSAFYDAMVTPGLVFDGTPEVAAFKCNAPGGVADPSTAAFHSFHGLIGGAEYYVKCSWSGSEAGIADANAGASKSFLEDPVGGAIVAGDGIVQIGEITATAPAAAELISATVDLGTADNSVLIAQAAAPNLVGSEIGIIPFIYVKNRQSGLGTAEQAAYDRLVNVTHPQIRVALTAAGTDNRVAAASGGTSLALFTGSPLDDTVLGGGNGFRVFLAGRDRFSGTRANCMADNGFGVKKTTFQTNLGGSDGAVTAASAGPNGGESSGGTLVTEMGYSGSGQRGWFAISYIGLADYLDAGMAGGLVPLTLNGVACDPVDAHQVKQGAYSYWGKEHIFDRPANPNTAAHTFFAKLTTPIAGDPEGDTPLQQGVAEPKAIKLSVMRALKATDLSDATHKP